MNNYITITPLFPSLLLSKQITNFSEIREELLKWIQEYKKKDNSKLKMSNFGGYQSPHHVFEEKTFEKFSKIIEDDVKECLKMTLVDPTFEITESWINVNGKNNFNRTHCHPDADLAAVLWIKTEKEKSGCIEFENPSVFQQFKLLKKINPKIKENFYVSQIRGIIPVEGLMLIFPSHINHFVFPNEINSERISIAFNIKI